MWNNVEALTKAARWAPYVFIVLGFLIALTGQFVRVRLDERVKALKSDMEAKRRATPPKLDAYLSFFRGSETIGLVIKFQNLIPIRARWLVTTEGGVVVSGLMLGDEEIHPTEQNKRFTYKANLDTNAIKNNLVQLKFTYQSLYFAESGRKTELQGVIAHRYVLTDGQPGQID